MRMVVGKDQMTRAAGAASTAAPYMRRLVEDKELRDSLRSLLRSAGRLYDELSEDDRFRRIMTDDKIRKDVDHVLEAMQDAGKRVMKPRRNWTPVIIVGTLAGGATVVALYRPARERVLAAARGTGSKAGDVMRSGGEKAGEMIDKAAEATAPLRSEAA